MWGRLMFMLSKKLLQQGLNQQRGQQTSKMQAHEEKVFLDAQQTGKMKAQKEEALLVTRLIMYDSLTPTIVMVLAVLLFVCLFTFLLWIIARHMRNTARHRRQESNQEEENSPEYENESPVGLFGGSPSVHVPVGRKEQRQTLSAPSHGVRRSAPASPFPYERADVADSGQTCHYQSLNLNLNEECISHIALKKKRVTIPSLFIVKSACHERCRPMGWKAYSFFWTLF